MKKVSDEIEGDSAATEDAEMQEELRDESSTAGKAKPLDLKAPTEQKNDLPPLRVFEAALFLANRPTDYAELSKITGFPRELCKTMARELKSEYAARDSAIEVVAGDEVAALQLKGEYLDRVARASKETNLSKKGTRILALIAKKKEILQKELKHYFRGEIYAYVTELRQAGYIEAQKHGQTRLLR
ncbi:MAG: SMC-Scp complex subunit ScpB, partial [Candidatus Norongarragalinales archaeon]